MAKFDLNARSRTREVNFYISEIAFLAICFLYLMHKKIQIKLGVANAAALVYGNGELSNMFAAYADGKTGAIDDGEQKNAYGLAYEALENAIVALDAKVKDTNTNAIAALEAILKRQESPEGGYFDYVDYELYTFRRWQGWMIHAWDMVNSQKGENPPALRALDIAYTTHMVEMTYFRMLRKVASKNYLADAIADADAKTKDKVFTSVTWAPYKAALDFANEVMAEPVGTPEAPQLRQSKVNAARLDLIKATNNLVERTAMLVPAEGKKTAIDMEKGIVSKLKVGLQANECEDFFKPLDGYTITVTPVAENTSVGTGSVIEIKDESGAVVDTYSIVIFGDLDGDGQTNGSDITILSDIVSGKISPNTVLFTAADINWDKKVNGTDYDIYQNAIDFEMDIEQTIPME